MNAMVNRMLDTYGRAQVDSGVQTASPHKLVSLLYEGALVAIANAKIALQEGNISVRGASISKAIAIIEEGLKVSLDRKAGGELAENLVILYEYMAERLLEANIKSDRIALDEVESLLRELKGAWEQIANVAPMATKTQPAPKLQQVSASYGRA